MTMGMLRVKWTGVWWFLIGDLMGLDTFVKPPSELLLEVLRSWSFSSSSNTLDILGLDLSYGLRHNKASVATVNATFLGYWRSSLDNRYSEYLSSISQIWLFPVNHALLYCQVHIVQLIVLVIQPRNYRHYC